MYKKVAPIHTALLRIWADLFKKTVLQSEEEIRSVPFAGNHYFSHVRRQR